MGWQVGRINKSQRPTVRSLADPLLDPAESHSMRALVVLLCLLALSPVVAAEEAVSGNVLIDVVLPLSLAFIMFSLGLGLTVVDFQRVLDEPKAFAVGLLNQMVVLPIIGFALATAFGLSGELAVGLVILACCPGGVTSNLVTRFARGDTALSISYTAVVSVASVVTLPLIVAFAIDHFMGAAAPDLDIISLGLAMFAITAVPVGLGMLVRARAADTALSFEPKANLVARVLFVIIIIGALASEWDTFIENLPKLGPSVVVLNVLMLGIGYSSAMLLDLGARRATTIAIESGVQNATVGITVGSLILAAEGSGLSVYSLPSGVYGIMMYFVTMPFVWWRIQQSEE